MRTIPSTDGVALAVHGPVGTGPDLLFAHATGLHGMVWAPLATRLSTRFRCWSLDFRGHGLSFTPPDHDYHWHRFRDDVSAVTRGLALNRPLAIGHSKGGTALVMTELAQPGTFRGLYLYEPILIPPDFAPGPNPLADVARRRRASFASRDEAYANYAAKPPLSLLHPDALRAYVDHGFINGLEGRVHLACRPDDEARVFEMARSHDTWADLPRLRCPVLVAAGGESDIPATLAPRVAERIPDARAEFFPSLGHFGPLQDPDRLADAIGAFFATLI